MLTLQKHLGNVQRNLWYVARLPALPLYVTKGQSPARVLQDPLFACWTPSLRTGAKIRWILQMEYIP